MSTNILDGCPFNGNGPLFPNFCVGVVRDLKVTLKRFILPLFVFFKAVRLALGFQI
jgi:hypothetical protein